MALTVAALMTIQYREARAQNPGNGSAPVTIVNPLPLPVTTTDADAAARTPFQTHLSTILGQRQFQVPSDQRFTIEFVTVRCVSPDLRKGQLVSLRTKATVEVDHTIPAGVVFDPPGGFAQSYGGASTVHLSADPGSVVEVRSATTDCNLTLAGFLSPV